MGFITPTFKRKRLITAAAIGLTWLAIMGMLWAYPSGTYRRGWAYHEYGIFKSFTRVTDYRTGSTAVTHEPGEGLVLSISISFIVSALAIGIYRLLLRRWRLPWHCVECDYDLRGNTSGRCPECGHQIPIAESEQEV